MLETVTGIYRDGQIELTEQPQSATDRAQVLVTFLDPAQTDPTQLRELIDRLETIAGLQQGFTQLNNGQTRLLDNFIRDMQSKYDIPS
jgi:hypothetical protein